jgi:hypothetical protein
MWLQEVFARQLRQLDPFRELGDEDVRTAIKNSSGVAGAQFWLSAVTVNAAKSSCSKHHPQVLEVFLISGPSPLLLTIRNR